MNKVKLKAKIVRSLRRQGFCIVREQLTPPVGLDKSKIRELHALAVSHQIEKCKEGLIRYQARLLARIANGSDITPSTVNPRLIQVEADSEDELLFRYARLHWSIPVSAGYGRRLRFLVVDHSNGKLIGIIGLADPVFSLGARDEWIGWDSAGKRERLSCVMDAFVLGAVPPYSSLLCGKLVAALAGSVEVRDAFRRKYSKKESLISERRADGRLALVTTTSALGRSSIYNRLRIGERRLYVPVGFTRGSGDFHFSNGLYKAIYDYSYRWCDPSAKRLEWGTGFRNRREVVRKCLTKIGVTTDWQYHGIKREIFMVPLASNAREFLRGEHQRLRWYRHSVEEISDWFRERWLLPRAAKDEQYRAYQRESYRLWSQNEAS
jgi:hypothetical protein